MEEWITSPVGHFEVLDLADLPLHKLCSPTLFSQTESGISSTLQTT